MKVLFGALIILVVLFVFTEIVICGSGDEAASKRNTVERNFEERNQFLKEKSQKLKNREIQNDLLDKTLKEKYKMPQGDKPERKEQVERGFQKPRTKQDAKEKVEEAKKQLNFGDEDDDDTNNIEIVKAQFNQILEKHEVVIFSRKNCGMYNYQ
jgi:hypothetical protein